MQEAGFNIQDLKGIWGGEGIPVALNSDGPQHKSSFPQVTLGKLLNISEAEFSHMDHRDDV